MLPFWRNIANTINDVLKKSFFYVSTPPHPKEADFSKNI